MSSKPTLAIAKMPGHSFLIAAVATLACCVATGCALGPLAKHAAAFSAAAGPVIDSSEDAYRAANDLHHEVAVATVVAAYGQPGWTPSQAVKPLLTPQQIAARTEVLDGLKSYAATLVALTGKPSDADTAALNGAATNVGNNLLTLDTTVTTNFSKALAEVPVMTTIEANGVSTAVVALGKYLDRRKLERSLPKVTEEMNKSVMTLCELLDRDVVVLRRQADVDYTMLIGSVNQFIGANDGKLDPILRRDEVGRLVVLAARQQATDAQLESLKEALRKLALTHQALAESARGGNPETLKQKIAELAAAGKELAAFYKSLPTS